MLAGRCGVDSSAPPNALVWSEPISRRRTRLAKSGETVAEVVSYGQPPFSAELFPLRNRNQFTVVKSGVSWGVVGN